MCNVWMPGAPGMNTSASADGGSYFCDFDDTGWSLQPGEDLAVYYYGLDNNAVINVFTGQLLYLPLIRRY